MAILNYLSVQETPDYRKRPTDDHGKFRIQFFSVPAANVTVIGDADSTFQLCDLPSGAVRVLPCLSRITTSAFGAARTLDLGHRAYQTRPPDNANEPENPTAFITDMDISGAVNAAAFSTVLKYDVYSMAGVSIYARVQGGTVPIGASLSGFITYIYE